MNNLIKKETFWIYPEVQYPTNMSFTDRTEKTGEGNCHEEKRITFSELKIIFYCLSLEEPESTAQVINLCFLPHIQWLKLSLNQCLKLSPNKTKYGSLCII